jgi:hypothetical protein
MTAKRGDLIVIETVRHDYVIGQGPSERRQFEVYEVAGLFRVGGVRTVRSVAWSGNHVQTLEGRQKVVGLVRIYLLPAAGVDKAAAIEAVKAHTYPNSTTPMPFASLDEVRALLKPFVLKEGSAA